MIRIRTAVLCGALLALAAGPSLADVSREIAGLGFRRPVAISTDFDAAESPWIEVREDSLLATKTRPDFGDLRFMNGDGVSLPFATLAPRLVDIHYSPWRTMTPDWRVNGGREEWTIDLGEEHPGLLSFDFGEESDPSLQFTGSDDGDTWSYVQWGGAYGSGMTFAEGRTGPVTNPALTVPWRWLKVTRNHAPRDAAQDVRILRYEERPSPRESLAFTTSGTAFRDRSWQVDVALDGPERSVGALVLEVPRATPARLSIRLEAGRGDERSYVSITRMPDWSAGPRDTLTFLPVRTGILRVIVESADPPNAPFTVAGVQAVPYRWRLPMPSGPVWAGYGDDYLEPRSWAMEEDAERALLVADARLGAEEANPFHAEPGFGLEWLKRRPAILSVTMVVLILLVALLTIRRRPPGAAALLFLVLASCGRSTGEETLDVWAAASLTDVLPKVAAARSKTTPEVRFTFDATSRLARQIEEGAPADLFFSADEDWMNDLVGKKEIDPATRVDLLGNDLVLVVPRNATPDLATPDGLRSEDVTRIGLADAAVPAGRYAREALIELGLWSSVERRVVNGSSVRTVLAWTARGEVDAGIVYASDARIEPGVRTAFTFPPGSHPAIVYPAAVTAAAAHARAAREFLRFCRSDTARTLFEAAGFRVR